MAERVIVKQDKRFQTIFLAADPEDPHSLEFERIEDLHQLTPYGMLLSGLGSCTALVMHTFAQNHELALDAVEIHLSYQRVFREDCEGCDENLKFTEEIGERILLKGNLSTADRQKLLRIAHYCPIFKMLADGLKVSTSLIEQKDIADYVEKDVNLEEDREY
jgi:uncharacterized OsmC-like protein